MTPRPVRAVLADLDDTLFDHSAATRRSLQRLCGVETTLASRPFDDLVRAHNEILETLHRDVLAGRRTIDEARDERFRRLLALGGETDEPATLTRARAAARFYRQVYQETWAVVPGAEALLGALRQAGLPIVVVTNNSTREQRLKLEQTGLAPLIDVLVTSEDEGVSKPDARIFRAALARIQIEAEDAVMFGDAWAADIAGARSAGIRAVWFNRWNAPTPDGTVAEVRSLEPAAEVAEVILGRV